MSDPNRAHPQNILTAIAVLNIIMLKIERVVEEKKEDTENLTRILVENNILYQNEIEMFIDSQLQKHLIAIEESERGLGV